MSPRYKNFASTLLVAAVIAMAGTAAAQNEQFSAQTINLQSLRLAIEDLNVSFGKSYPKGKEFLGQLHGIEKQLAMISSRQDLDAVGFITSEYIAINGSFYMRA